MYSDDFVESVQKSCKKCLVSLSGGMDSVTLTYLLVKALGKENVKTVSFNYNSKHNDMEYACVEKVCKVLGITNERIDITFINQIFKSDLLKSGGDIPEGHYAADNMKSTVVPFRNGIMLSVTAGYAESIEFDTIGLASHTGDHFVYPDCRPEFAEYMSKAIEVGTWKGIKLATPFGNISKSDLTKIGLEIGVDYNLSYSCYNGKNRPCLVCGTCSERTEAFLNNNSKDPILTDEEWNKAVEIYRNIKTPN